MDQKKLKVWGKCADYFSKILNQKGSEINGEDEDRQDDAMRLASPFFFQVPGLPRILLLLNCGYIQNIQRYV